jgi:hypothetical protein
MTEAVGHDSRTGVAACEGMAVDEEEAPAGSAGYAAAAVDRAAAGAEWVIRGLSLAPIECFARCHRLGTGPDSERRRHLQSLVCDPRSTVTRQRPATGTLPKATQVCLPETPHCSQAAPA